MDDSVPPDSREAIPLRTLVANQLSVRRKICLDAGWEAFHKGDYQSACSKFALADGYGSVGTAERLEARVPLLYARIATQQYAGAIEGLKWMLENYSRSDPQAASPLVNLAPDLTARYGRRSELAAHLDALGSYVARCAETVRKATDDPRLRGDLPRLGVALAEARALQLVELYAVPEQRARVAFEVGQLANLPAPWDKLSKFLESNELNRGGSPRKPAAGDAHPADEFPFNLFQEAPPPDVAAPLSSTP